MIVIVAVDDRQGMLFNKRRQSQDRILREKLLSMTKRKKLWMNHYSYSQFEQEGDNQIVCVDNFLDLAGEGEYCFVETELLQPYVEKVEKLILVKWNRRYPGDQFLDLELKQPEWTCVKSEEFPGSSHKKLTMEVYEHEK